MHGVGRILIFSGGGARALTAERRNGEDGVTVDGTGTYVDAIVADGRPATARAGNAVNAVSPERCKRVSDED